MNCLFLRQRHFLLHLLHFHNTLLNCTQHKLHLLDTLYFKGFPLSILSTGIFINGSSSLHKMNGLSVKLESHSLLLDC